MVHIDHIRKYIQDHPKDFENPKLTIEAAQTRAAQNGLNGSLLYSGELRELIPGHADHLFNLMETQHDYLEISARCASSLKSKE